MSAATGIGPEAGEPGGADMSGFSAFRYDGKRALVVGGASGMGAAVDELEGGIPCLG